MSFSPLGELTTFIPNLLAGFQGQLRGRRKRGEGNERKRKEQKGKGRKRRKHHPLPRD